MREYHDYERKVLLWVRIAVSAIALIASLVDIALPSVQAESKWWAYFTVGAIIGYWLR
jgi:hypothetical protein